jgi:anti-anti-sigma factor
MAVRVHARRNVLVLTVSGALDLVSAPLLDSPVTSALRGSWRLVVVDVGTLEFVDVVGAAPLLRLAGGLAGGRRLVVTGAGRAVAGTLSRLGLEPFVVPVEATPELTDAAVEQLLLR